MSEGVGIAGAMDYKPVGIAPGRCSVCDRDLLEAGTKLTAVAAPGIGVMQACGPSCYDAMMAVAKRQAMKFWGMQ